MSEAILSDVAWALKLAIFQRDGQERLRLAGRVPAWLGALWPQVAAAGGLTPETSPFLDNFLVDAAARWRAGGEERVVSGPWVETDPGGREHHLQATALTVADRAILVIEEMGLAYDERTAIMQTAHEAAPAYEKLQRTERGLAEQKRLLEQRVQERTIELSRANAALREEVAMRRSYAERLQSMRAIDKAILAAQSPEAIAEAALRRLHPMLPCEHASIVALDSDSGTGTILASYHEGEVASGGGWELSNEQLREAQVLKSGQLHRIADAPNLFGRPAGARAAKEKPWPLIVDFPLLAEDTLVGVLNLAMRSPGAFTREHEEIAEDVAAQIAVAIRQARLFLQVSGGREQLRALSLRLVEVQEAERRFMAHELHDEIGQLLTGLKLTLELPGQDTTGPGANVGEAIALVDELMDRVRQLSLDLRPQVLDDLGLLAALDWLFKRYQKQTGISIQFRHTSARGRLPARLETAAFRIVQEALTNIARHARVREAAVRLWLDDRNLGVQIEDHGAGFDAEEALAGRTSSGVAGMRERALMLGGEFTLEAKPGRGTRLTVELPLSAGGPAAGPAGGGR